MTHDIRRTLAYLRAELDAIGDDLSEDDATAISAYLSDLEVDAEELLR